MKQQKVKDLRSIYRSNPKVRTFCEMIAVLALLPENDVRLGFENLKEVADGMCLRTILLLEYIERVYAGSEGLQTGFRSLHGMPTFKPFDGILGPSTCAKDGMTH